MDRYHTHGLGQVLLTSPHWITKIVQALDIQPGDPIIEIGPGKGALTMEILKHCHQLSPMPTLHLVEKDPDMVGQVIKLLPDWVGIENKDFLDFNLDGIPENTKIISNLPYSSSTAILIRLLRYQPQISRMVLMFQREVAQRIKAKSGTKGFGRLAAMSRTFWRISSLGVVPPGAFKPKPAIHSEVLVFSDKCLHIPEDFDRYERLVAGLFAYPRRTILNSMALSFKSDKETLRQRLSLAGIDPTTRPSNLSIEQIRRLFVLGIE